MTSLRQNAAWLAVLLPLAGCGPARVAFVPSRAVDSANVDGLALVLCAKFEQESVLDRLSEGVNAIGPVAVDSEAGLLYVHRQVRVGLSYGIKTSGVVNAPAEFADALAHVRMFLGPVATALAEHQIFDRHWAAGGPWA